MATYTAGPDGFFNEPPLDLSFLSELGENSNASSTGLTITVDWGAGDVEVWVFTGTGLTYGVDGTPTGGTVTAISNTYNGVLQVSVTGLSVSAASLAANLGNDAGLQTLLFGGADTFIGANVADALYGFEGADTFTPGGGADIVVGGNGDDTVIISTGQAGESLDGGNGTDTLRLLGVTNGNIDIASLVPVTLSGFERVEFIGGPQAVTLGLFAVEQLGSGLSTAATIVGSSDTDALVFVVTAAGTWTLGAMSFTFENWNGYSVTNPLGDFLGLNASLATVSVTLEGGALGDVLTGGSANDTLFGGGGDDVLAGGGGVDTYYGEGGNDTLLIGVLPGPPSEDFSLQTYNGGDGQDRLGIVGDVVLTGGTFTSVEGIVFTAGGNSSLTLTDTVLAQFGATPTITGAGSAFSYGLEVQADGDVDLSGAVFVNWNEGFGYIAIGGSNGSETITGSDVADSINGDLDPGAVGAADIIHGGAGDDFLDGWGGGDQVYGDEGEDWIEIYVGEIGVGELADGGDGYDFLNVNAGDVGQILADLTGVSLASFEGLQLDGDSESGPTFTTIITAAHVSSAFASALEVVGSASGVDDTIRINGAAGVTVDVSNWSFTAWDATDVIEFEGSAGADTFIGSSVKDVVDGGAGADTLSGGLGADILNGDAGNDLISGGAGADTINGGADVDTLSYASSTGAVDVRLITGFVAGGDAAGDVISNIENLIGSTKADVLVGDDGVNTIWGGAGADAINGRDGVDTLYGEFGADQLLAGAGDDFLIGGAGADTLGGGGGIDTADYSTSSAGVTVDLSPQFGTGVGGDAQGDELVSIENVIGSAFADTITGKAGVANTLAGGAGADTLLGLSGDDVLNGGAGADTLNGGDGADTASYANSTSGVEVRLFSGVALYGEAAGDTLTSIENLIGSIKIDTLAGDANANVIYGGGGGDGISGREGNDTLYGEAGNDALLGGDGSDTLIGGAGADVLGGGAGADTADYSASASGVTINLVAQTGVGGDAQGDSIVSCENLIGSAFADTFIGNGQNNVFNGGLGNDTMTGASGNDQFVIASGAGSDVITDFVAGSSAIDTIRLTGFGAAFDTAAEVIAAASQSGADVVIAFGGGQTLTLQNITLASLHANDFVFG